MLEGEPVWVTQLTISVVHARAEKVECLQFRMLSLEMKKLTDNLISWQFDLNGCTESNAAKTQEKKNDQMSVEKYNIK